MRHALATLGLIAVGAVALAVKPVQAQTTANGPYYANPAWDQTLTCTSLNNCPRFVVLSNFNNAAVLDRETGLVWERSPSASTFTWSDAQAHCNNVVSVGNRLGWRLPTLQELASLVDRTVAAPTLPAGHPFTIVQFGIYWSATTDAANASAAWVVEFDVGKADTGTKSSSLDVWCVRGGQGVDPQ
jgi:hypothetical protein